jgi:hypothetical protein
MKRSGRRDGGRSLHDFLNAGGAEGFTWVAISFSGYEFLNVPVLLPGAVFDGFVAEFPFVANFHQGLNSRPTHDFAVTIRSRIHLEFKLHPVVGPRFAGEQLHAFEQGSQLIVRAVAWVNVAVVAAVTATAVEIVTASVAGAA